MDKQYLKSWIRFRFYKKTFILLEEVISNFRLEVDRSTK